MTISNLADALNVRFRTIGLQTPEHITHDSVKSWPCASRRRLHPKALLSHC